MRILAGADFHGSLDHYRWFLGEARDLQAEALILAGDLFGYADEDDDPDEDQRLNAAQIKDLFRSCDPPILLIMGNDDHFDIEETWEGWTPLHGHSHAGFGRSGRHFNVALARRKRAIVIELPSLIHLMVQQEVESV